MKMISTYLHGILDFAVVLVLLFLPTLFGFANVGGAPVWVPRTIALVALLQSLATQYEFGLFKVLPMKMHLMADYVLGVFLAASPWLFGFADRAANVWVPHLVMGLVVFGTTLMTKETAPKRARA
jgi:SPW repeat-containing protein